MHLFSPYIVNGDLCVYSLRHIRVFFSNIMTSLKGDLADILASQRCLLIVLTGNRRRSLIILELSLNNKPFGQSTLFFLTTPGTSSFIKVIRLECTTTTKYKTCCLPP
ncbi:hypothetical protein XENORESO_008161 [Xenotaenia resolanae]|uniref:Uncharacterized protein n=1 Tax=Xenotaenia resolanae TaxID=208358 RepID=A0ABV0VP91_9TELE